MLECWNKSDALIKLDQAFIPNRSSGGSDTKRQAPEDRQYTHTHTQYVIRSKLPEGCYTFRGTA